MIYINSFSDNNEYEKAKNSLPTPNIASDGSNIFCNKKKSLFRFILIDEVQKQVVYQKDLNRNSINDFTIDSSIGDTFDRDHLSATIISDEYFTDYNLTITIKFTENPNITVTFEPESCSQELIYLISADVPDVKQYEGYYAYFNSMSM